MVIGSFATNQIFEDIAEVTLKIAQSEELPAVSDSGVRDNDMFHGWVSNDGKHEIPTGCGRCNDGPSSMRVEAAGMLAITQFLGTVRQFTNSARGNLEVKFCSDNKASVTGRNDQR